MKNENVEIITPQYVERHRAKIGNNLTELQNMQAELTSISSGPYAEPARALRNDIARCIENARKGVYEDISDIVKVYFSIIEHKYPTKR